MELKTLKDFMESKYKSQIAAVCVMKDIKKEAIKWIKYFQLHSLYPNSADTIPFKDFFNITEEDLK